MKAFLVLPFLLLLFGSSQESALSRKRSIRGLNTTLQTNFNGTFQIKNPCTNADLETSSYVASHEFHHHIKENNWSDYLQKCSSIINSFLQGIGNLVRVNSKQNAAFNFHVNTSISQKQDIGDCKKQCESLPTIVIEAESCELPPPCKSSQKARRQYLLKQDLRQNSDKTPENYSTTSQFPTKETLKEGLHVEEKQQKHQKLINYGSEDNITPVSGFSTSAAQAGIGETNDLSQNHQTTCKSDFFGTSGRDFTASITIKPEDESTTSLTPDPWQDYSEDSLFGNPVIQDYPYLTPTISEYQPLSRPSFNDQKTISNQYQVDQKPHTGDFGEKILDKTPVRTSTSDFESESIRVEKPFKYQHTTPLGLGKPNYVEEIIPPSERFQSADLQTKPYRQILDKFPLRQPTQSIDDMYINTTPKHKEKILPQGDSLSYSPRPETLYPSQTNEHKNLTIPSVDYLTTPPSNPSIPENHFQPQPTSTNEFSKSKLQSITNIHTPLTEQPFIPRKKFPTKLPTKTPNHPEQPSSYTDAYTMGPENPINDFYTPAASKFRKTEKIPLRVDNLDNIYTTISPPESVTIYDSDEDVLNDRLSLPTLDEEFYIKSQSYPPSGPFLKDHPLLNEKTTPDYSSLLPSDDYKNPDFESLKPTFRTSESKAQSESESLTMLQSTATYPEVEVPRFSNFEDPSHPPKRTFEPTTTPPPSPGTYVENGFYTSGYPSTPENSPPSTLEPLAYSEASSQASTRVEEQGFNDFKNPDQQPREPFEPIITPSPPVTYSENDFYASDYFSTPENSPHSTLKPIAYSEASSQASVQLEEPGFNDFENHDQPGRNLEPVRTSPPSVTYPEDEFYPKSVVNEPPSTSTSLESFEPTSYAEASSQASAEIEETGFPKFENPNHPSRPRLEQTAYAEASSQASTGPADPGFNDFENPDQPETAFEPIVTPPQPVTNPKDDSYFLDNRRTSGNSPVFTRPQTSLKTIESNSYAVASSEASAEVEEAGFPKFENFNQPSRPRLEQIAYAEDSSQSSIEPADPGFNDFENPDKTPKAFEPITPPVTYPTDNFYPSDYPFILGNPPLSTLKPIAYSEASSQASVQLGEPGFNDFENHDQPRRNSEPVRTSPPSVTYPEDEFYPKSVVNEPPSTSTSLESFEPTSYAEASSQASAEIEETGFPKFENPSQPPRSRFEPIAYERASSQAAAKAGEPGINDFENPDQTSRAFESITTPPPPVTYPVDDFYTSDYPSTLENSPTSTSEPIAYSKTSSQASAKIEKLGFNDFEHPDETPRPRLEPTAYSEPSSQTFADIEKPGLNDFENTDQPPKVFDPVPYPKDSFYPSALENPSSSTFEPVIYSGASPQASVKVEESSVNDFENREQPRRNFSPPSVTYPEEDFYPKSVVNEPQFTPPLELFEPSTFAEASSKVPADIQDSRFPNFEKTDQQPKGNFEPITTPPPPVSYSEGDFYPTPVATILNEPQTNFENSNHPPRQSFESITDPLSSMNNPENDFYPSNYPPKIPFEDLSRTPNSKDYPTDFLPTTQSPDNLSFSSLEAEADAQSESIIRNDYNRLVPTDLPQEADSPLWTKGSREPQSLPVNVENDAVVLSHTQSDLPFNQFAPPQPQPPTPLNYYDERVSDLYSQKPLVPLDTTSIPQPQSEDITTPPPYQNYTSREEPFAGDLTHSAVKSQEKMLIYSQPFELEPQPQPSSYVPGDSKTFENSKTSNLLSSNLESQDRSSFGTSVDYPQSSDFLTTPTPLTDIPSFQTPLRSKPEEITTNSQQNIGAQETLLFGINVSPQPQPTTAVKTYKEIVTTEYQTSPAPSPQPQTAMNNPNQHSDDNLNGKIPRLYTNQQQLVTSEPDFDLSTSDISSKSFSQSEQITGNYQKADYPVEEAPEAPLNYPNPNSYLPYNNQLRSQPIYRQPPPRHQGSPMNSPQNPSENAKQDVPLVREVGSEPSLRDSRILASSRMQPEDNVWMSRSNEQVPIHPGDNLRPPAPNSQIPSEPFFYPEQNYNAREDYFPEGSRGGFSRPAPNFPSSYESRRSINPDFQRELITDSRTNSYNRPQSFDSFNSGTKKTESPAEKQFGYQEKFFNDKRISEHVRDDRRFEPSENFRPSNRPNRPRNFPQHPQQVEPFYEGFPPNVSYPDYGQIRPQNDFPVSGRDYPQYDHVFPDPPPRPQFVQDEVIPPSMSNMQFDRRVPGVNENKYYPERPQRPGNYLPDREPLFEKQQYSNPLFQTLEDQMKIPLQEPPPPEMPNESQRNYFRDNSSGWERPNPPSPLPESQSVPDLTVPSNNPDRAANGRFNYMDRPLRKPFYEDRMRPVSTPERL